MFAKEACCCDSAVWSSAEASRVEVVGSGTPIGCRCDPVPGVMPPSSEPGVIAVALSSMPCSVVDPSTEAPGRRPCAWRLMPSPMPSCSRSAGATPPPWSCGRSPVSACDNEFTITLFEPPAPPSATIPGAAAPAERAVDRAVSRAVSSQRPEPRPRDKSERLVSKSSVRDVARSRLDMSPSDSRPLISPPPPPPPLPPPPPALLGARGFCDSTVRLLAWLITSAAGFS